MHSKFLEACSLEKCRQVRWKGLHVVRLRGWRSHARCFMGTLVLAKSWAMTSYVFQALELLTGYKPSGAIGQTALKPQHVFLHGEGHSQSVLPGLAKPTIVSEEHHAAASCTHVGCYGTATSLEWADLLFATSILGHGCSVHLLGALLEAFPVLSHRKKKFSSSQTLLPLV